MFSTIIAVAVAWIVLLFFPPPVAGDSVTDAAVLESVKLTVGAYQQFAEIAVISFGAVAFFATYALKKGLKPGETPLNLLALGLVLLGGSLVSALLSIDLILEMVAANVVALEWWVLRVGRWMTVGFLVVGAGLVGSYGLRALSEPLPEGGGPSPDEED